MADDFPDFVKFEGFAGQAWYHQHMREKRILRRAREFTPERLLEKGEQGAWYDPSDTTTLFQDSAGTTPVTASGQPVGLMLDKHVSDGRGVVNRLTLSTQFDRLNVWAPVFFSGTVQANTHIAPDGSMTADRVISGGADRVQRTNTPATNGQIKSIWARTVSGTGTTALCGHNSLAKYRVTLTESWQRFEFPVDITESGGSDFYAVDFRFGTLTEVVLWGAQLESGATASVTQVNGDTVGGPGNHASQPTAASRPIYRRGDSRGVVNQLLNTETLATQSRAVTAVGHTLSFTGTGSITLSGASTAGPLVGTGVNDRVSLTFTPTAGSLTLTVSGSVTKGQLNLGPTALPYQRNDSHLGGVATGASTDLHWLETDGVDDGMVTGNIAFTGTDKVSVFAGVRKLSDAASGAVAELSENSNGKNAFLLTAPEGAAPTAGMSVRGDNFANTAVTGVVGAAPLTFVMGTAVNRALAAGEVLFIRKDGVPLALTTVSSGNSTGNFGNYPLYLFRRAGTSLPFNGWFYGLAITGRLTTDAETVATERYLATKSAVVIP